MDARRGELAGRRVLVVEDEYLLATDLQRELERRGAEVVGPVAALAEAMALADGAALDAAVLDVNLRGELSFPLADALRARGVPFAFATGYDREVLPDRFGDVPRWEKPFDLDRSLDALGAMATRGA